MLTLMLHEHWGAMDLLSICLSIRDKRKQRQGEELAHIQHPGVEPHAHEEDR